MPANPAALVSVEWLREHLDDPDLRLVHIGNEDAGREQYEAAHLPGAVRADGYEDFTEDREFRALVPSPEKLERTLGQLGIGPQHRVVFYATARSAWPARGYWVLKYYRFPNVHVLDGGIDVLREAGLTVTQESVQPRPISVELSEPDASIMATSEQVLGVAEGSGGAIVDCRNDDEWHGLSGGHSPQPRLGRIPRAVHLDWEKLVDEQGCYLAVEQARALYTAAGVDGSRPVYTYCGGGIRSAVGWIVLHELLGFELAANYDGSWSEWAARPELPIETG